VADLDRDVVHLPAPRRCERDRARRARAARPCAHEPRRRAPLGYVRIERPPGAGRARLDPAPHRAGAAGGSGLERGSAGDRGALARALRPRAAGRAAGRARRRPRACRARAARLPADSRARPVDAADRADPARRAAVARGRREPAPGGAARAGAARVRAALRAPFAGLAGDRRQRPAARRARCARPCPGAAGARRRVDRVDPHGRRLAGARRLRAPRTRPGRHARAGRAPDRHRRARPRALRLAVRGGRGGLARASRGCSASAPCAPRSRRSAPRAARARRCSPRRWPRPAPGEPARGDRAACRTIRWCSTAAASRMAAEPSTHRRRRRTPWRRRSPRS